MGWRRASNAYLAVALIAISLASPFAYNHWLATRTFVALDVPVSVARGHVQTSEFDINLKGWYQVSIDIRLGVPVQDCRFTGSGFGLETHSRIFKDGHVVEKANGRDNFLGHFYAETKGRYKAEIAVLSDTGCLDTRHPRLLVWTAMDGYERLYNGLQVFSSIFILVGLGLLAFAAIGHVSFSAVPAETTGAFRGPAADYFVHSRLLLQGKVSGLPPFGLFYAMTLLAVILPSLLIFIYAWGLDRQSVGIPVHILRPRLSGEISEPCAGFPAVRLKYTGSNLPTRVYVNSKVVSWEQLDATLREELKNRTESAVCFHADVNVPWSDAINAMDIVRRLPAKVVLAPDLNARHKAKTRS